MRPGWQDRATDMAHECPECGYTCHCNGDIDDICWADSKQSAACVCCQFDNFEDDDDSDWNTF